MKDRARLTDIILKGNQNIQLYKAISNKFIHSNGDLNKLSYPWQGEIHIKEVKPTDHICVIDTFAYRARNKNGKIIRLKVGGYKYNNRLFSYKLMGVIRNGIISVVVEPANDRVKDIAPLAPVRVNGVYQAVRITKGNK